MNTTMIYKWINAEHLQSLHLKEGGTEFDWDERQHFSAANPQLYIVSTHASCDAESSRPTWQSGHRFYMGLLHFICFAPAFQKTSKLREVTWYFFHAVATCMSCVAAALLHLTQRNLPTQISWKSKDVIRVIRKLSYHLNQGGCPKCFLSSSVEHMWC